MKHACLCSDCLRGNDQPDRVAVDSVGKAVTTFIEFAFLVAVLLILSLSAWFVRPGTATSSTMVELGPACSVVRGEPMVCQ